jgi:NIPSNAP
MVGCCPVVELRQYTLRPGQREVLVELFDREFVESQEAAGIELIGQFRDLDRPDRFVWLRGFPDMERRRRALEAFYGGPVWKVHSAAANATMLDVDDVLLLRPHTPASGFGPQPPRPTRGARMPASMVVATICSLEGPADVAVVDRELLPALATTTSPALATFVEDPSENTFPALPVRTGEHVLVLIQRISAGEPVADHPRDDQLGAAAAVALDLLSNLAAAPLQLRLEPTPRSRLR